MGVLRHCQLPNGLCFMCVHVCCLFNVCNSLEQLYIFPTNNTMSFWSNHSTHNYHSQSTRYRIFLWNKLQHYYAPDIPGYLDSGVTWNRSTRSLTHGHDYGIWIDLQPHVPRTDLSIYNDFNHHYRLIIALNLQCRFGTQEESPSLDSSTYTDNLSTTQYHPIYLHDNSQHRIPFDINFSTQTRDVDRLTNLHAQKTSRTRRSNPCLLSDGTSRRLRDQVEFASRGE